MFTGWREYCATIYTSFSMYVIVFGSSLCWSEYRYRDHMYTADNFLSATRW